MHKSKAKTELTVKNREKLCLLQELTSLGLYSAEVDAVILSFLVFRMYSALDPQQLPFGVM